MARTAWVSWVGKVAVGTRAVKNDESTMGDFDRGCERTVVQNGDTDLFVFFLQLVLDVLPEARRKVGQW